jgi:hypothetical protein
MLSKIPQGQIKIKRKGQNDALATDPFARCGIFYLRNFLLWRRRWKIATARQGNVSAQRS